MRREVVAHVAGRREIRTLEEVQPTEGKRLQLTIDLDVQQAIEDAFKVADQDGIATAGAAVVLDVKLLEGKTTISSHLTPTICRLHRKWSAIIAAKP